MKGRMKAEITKVLTTRASYGLLAGTLGVVAVTVASTTAGSEAAADVPLNDHVFFLLVSINAGLFSLVLGIRLVTDENRYGTLIHSFLADPRRWPTLAAKALASALAAGVIAVAALVALVAVAVPSLAAKGVTASVDASDLPAAAAFVLANAAWAVIGVGLGAVVRHQTAAVVTGMLWVLVVENLGTGFLGAAGRFLPGQAAYAFGGALDGRGALEPSTAGAVMAVYVGSIFLLGVLMTLRRDAG